MAVKLTPTEFPLLRDMIEEISGIRVGDGKAYLIESRLGRLLKEYNCSSFSEFHLKSKNGRDREIRAKVINAMSTQETLWFRDMHPYRILETKLLPEFAEELNSGKRKVVRIWSAASSTGQEPYSLAMVILNAMKQKGSLRPEMFEIFATDIASSALEVAKAGLYDRIAMGRGLPPQYREEYFAQDGRYTRVSEKVKSLVRFREYNLKESFAMFGQFDVILCRNVAIYFADEFKRNLYARIKKALTPGGHLFLGSSESISAYSSEFELHEHGGAIYYQAKVSEAAPGVARAA